MNPELLSRIQFALTISFHYIYPPISMGLGIILVIFGVLYVRTKEQKWRELSFYWLKIYSLVFAMGIATGVVQEFEFGMNWSSYSRFVGNIFGSLLAAEGVFAFFLEGGFLGLMLFGGSRLGPRLWLLATTLVVFGAHFSALWIVMANSWMQTPAGYTLQQTPNGQIAVMQSFAVGRLHALVRRAHLPRLRERVAGRLVAGAERQRVASAAQAPRGAGEVSHPCRAADLRRAGVSAGLRLWLVDGAGGDEPSADQACRNGGPLADDELRAALSRRLGRSRHADDARNRGALSAQLPGVFQYQRAGDGAGRLSV